MIKETINKDHFIKLTRTLSLPRSFHLTSMFDCVFFLLVIEIQLI